MLRPRDTLTRERKSLTGLWRFCLDAAGEGRSAGWFREPLPDAREMAVPASYNDVFTDQDTRDHVGDAWYQTTVRVPRGWDGRRVVLYFESATHRATVWVDETEGSPTRAGTRRSRPTSPSTSGRGRSSASA